MQLLSDPDPDVVMRARYALVESAVREDAPFLTERIYAWKDLPDGRALIRKLGSVSDSRATLVLAELLRSSTDFEERRTLIESLGESRDASATPALVETLSDPEGPLRFAAIRALRLAGDLRAIEPLKKFIGPPLRPALPMSATATEAIWRIRLRSWMRFRFW